jgi:subtilase family serine protease
MRAGAAIRLAALLVAASTSVPALAARARGASQISRAADLGVTDGGRMVTITTWLRMHHGDALDQRVQQQRDPAAAGFENWSDGTDFSRSYAPSDADVAAVRNYLSASGLSVIGVGPQNLFVTAQGTASQVQSALKVELHDYRLGGRTYYSNTQKPTLPAGVEPLVAYVGGLNDLRPTPMNVHAFSPDGKGSPAKLSAAPAGFFFSADCFRPAETLHFTSSDADATYTGLRYGQDITNGSLGTLPPCAYQPSEIQAAYGLDKLYAAGLDGRGQTVAIVDAFGSTTIQEDLATFSAVMGLPPGDLTVLGTPTESAFSGTANSGWAIETTLDVEWVHAIAPRAKILLVVAEDNSFDNLFAGIVAASFVPGVSVISNSWGNIELATTPELRQAADGIFKYISSRGIAINFSSGDSGDEAINLGVADADWPASSPWVTAIGGVSLSLRNDNHIAFQTAWGNNLTMIADAQDLGSPPLDPVFNEGFVFGGGGGVSDVYEKPRFQRRLPGDRRQIPDISWLADPYTGAEYIFTGDPSGGQYFDSIGGTSLSCPMFSALWAIAAQKAGHKLGQAAARIYDLDEYAITDVKGHSSRKNVSGVILDDGGTSPEVASDLAAPLQNLPQFLSALYNSPYSTRWFVLTFGTDSTLPVTEGYDLATGLGTPNGYAFVDGVARHHH